MNEVKGYKMIVQKIYFRIVLILLSFVTAFHLGLIVKLIPYNLAWGGQLHNDFEMYLFESISIGINLFLGLVLLMKGNYIKSLFSYKKIRPNAKDFSFIICYEYVSKYSRKDHL